MSGTIHTLIIKATCLSSGFVMQVSTRACTDIQTDDYQKSDKEILWKKSIHNTCVCKKCMCVFQNGADNPVFACLTHCASHTVASLSLVAAITTTSLQLVILKQSKFFFLPQWRPDINILIPFTEKYYINNSFLV